RTLTGLFSSSSSRCLLSLSLSANGLSEFSGYTAETKATCDPSRDQRALPASALTCVSWRASPPSVAITQSCVPPERLDSNRTFLPSGDQRGWRSFLSVVVRR